MILLSLEPESSASANSATSAFSVFRRVSRRLDNNTMESLESQLFFSLPLKLGKDYKIKLETQKNKRK